MNLSELTNPEENLDSMAKPSFTSNITNQESSKEQNEKIEPRGDNLQGENKLHHMTQNENNVITRFTSEYRMLYNYLQEKYKAATDISKVLIDFEIYLKNLSKYQQLRNNMLVSTLLYLNNHESLNVVDYLDKKEIVKKLEHIKKIDYKLGRFASLLIDLEKAEDGKDTIKNLEKFDQLIGLDDALSSDLSIQELNIYPDIYHGNFESYEIVKKNQCFENTISSTLDLKELIHPETENTYSFSGTPKISRKRKSPTVSSTRSKRGSKKANVGVPVISPVTIMPRMELYETGSKNIKNN